MTNQNRTSTADSRKPVQQPSGDPRSQAEKFADLARELECDESEEGFDRRLKGLAKYPGHWKVVHGASGQCANFRPDDAARTYRPSPDFRTPQEVYGWLRAHGCRQSADDADVWFD